MPSKPSTRRTTATPSSLVVATGDRPPLPQPCPSPATSVKEITQWISGSKYARYAIEKPATSSPVRGISAGNQKSKAYERIGAGLAVSASHGQRASSHGNASALAAVRVGSGLSSKVGSQSQRVNSPDIPTTARDDDEGRATSSLTDKSIHNFSTSDPELAHVRAKLVDRTHYLQAALDARGSQYVCKIGKLSTTWLFGNNKSCERKARTPPRQNSPTKISTTHEKKIQTLPNVVGTKNSKVDSKIVTTAVDFGGSLSNRTVGSFNSGEGPLDSTNRQLSAPMVRQHLAASFGAVHLSPNSSTTVVLHQQGSDGHAKSTSGSPRVGDQPLIESLTTDVKSTAPSSRGGGDLTARNRSRSPTSNEAYDQGVDLGATYPIAELVRAKTPPKSPLHGGCYHNQQQHPRLFPALLGPYQHPQYYTRTFPTSTQLQDQREHRPISPTRHNNAKGIPSVERPYSPMHDIVRDEYFRVCGTEAVSPSPRPRPNAGPPMFLSPGFSAAAKRIYISSSPFAYQ